MAPAAVKGSPVIMPRFTTAIHSRSTSTAAAANRSPVSSPTAIARANVAAENDRSNRRPLNRTEPAEGG